MCFWLVLRGSLGQASRWNSRSVEEDDKCSLMQLSNRIHNVLVRDTARSGGGKIQTHASGSTIMSQNRIRMVEYSKYNTQNNRTQTVPDDDWTEVACGHLWKTGDIAWPAIGVFALAVLTVMCCSCCVLYEDAPPLFSYTRYDPASGKYDWKQCLLASTFAFISGWADAICVIRYHAFGTMMTGNLFQLGYTMVFPKVQRLNLVHRMADSVFYTLIIVAYITGGVIFRLAQIYCGKRVATFFGPFLACCLLVYELVDAATANPLLGSPRWVVCFLAPVFAVVNTLSTKGGLGLATGFASGHMQELASALASRISGQSIAAEARSKLLAQTIIIFSIISGAVSSAMVHKLLLTIDPNTHKDLTMLPIAPLLAASFVMHDRLYYKSDEMSDK